MCASASTTRARYWRHWKFATFERAVERLVGREQVEAISVCLLWSFRNPAHEQQVRAVIRRLAPSIHVAISSDVAPVPGEYERTSATVIDAYVGRVTKAYLAELTELLADAGYGGPVLVMQGYGGLVPITEATARPVGMIECGPAAGVVGAQYLAGILGDKNVIAADMGGTTFKVAVIQDGRFEYAREPMVDRYHYIAPKIDLMSIGAGGGSIVDVRSPHAATNRGPGQCRCPAGPDMLRVRRRQTDPDRRGRDPGLHGSGYVLGWSPAARR